MLDLSNLWSISLVNGISNQPRMEVENVAKYPIYKLSMKMQEELWLLSEEFWDCQVSVKTRQNFEKNYRF
jgi:hypothetical protein